MEDDWFGSGAWRSTPIYQRAPLEIERAMQALAGVVDPAWVQTQRRSLGGQRHPLMGSLMDTSYLGMWSAISTGLHLAALREVPVQLRQRLLHPAEFAGAASELAAAAALSLHGVSFEWHPREGGEFLIQGDAICYVEVKRPRYNSDRSDEEMERFTNLYVSISNSAPGLLVSFHLRPDILDSLTPRQRQAFDWTALERKLINAVNKLLRDNNVPGSSELDIGKIWLARTQEEMQILGSGGFLGVYVDNRHEIDRVIRGVINRAIRQLPPGQPSVISLDWTGTPPGFCEAVERRLCALPKTQAIAGVLVHHIAFPPRDIVPEHRAQCIVNPRFENLLRVSRAVHALIQDRYAALRSAAGG